MHRFMTIAAGIAFLAALGPAEAQQTRAPERAADTAARTLSAGEKGTAVHRGQLAGVKALTGTFERARERGQGFAAVRGDARDLECTGTTGAEIAACQEACLVLQDVSDGLGGGYGCSSNESGCSCTAE